jgi:hypothetical protein
MMPVEIVLDRLEGVTERGEGYQALCPAHDDREPSLSVSEGEDGRALIKCFAGCETEDVVGELGLEMRNLFERWDGHEKVFRSIPPRTAATVQPCTLENYAAAKGLPYAARRHYRARGRDLSGDSADLLVTLHIIGVLRVGEAALGYRLKPPNPSQPLGTHAANINPSRIQLPRTSLSGSPTPEKALLSNRQLGKQASTRCPGLPQISLRSQT